MHSFVRASDLCFCALSVIIRMFVRNRGRNKPSWCKKLITFFSGEQKNEDLTSFVISWQLKLDLTIDNRQ